MSESDCEAFGWACSYQNWRPFDFNFEQQYLWSNLVFYVFNLASLLFLCILSHKIKTNDFIKSYIVLTMYSPACLMVFALFFDINRLLDVMYINHYLTDIVLKIFNGIAKTTFLISSGVVLIMAMWMAYFRRPMSKAWCWAPFCLVMIFAIIWLFFFANRLHIYIFLADAVLLLLAMCVFLCCSSFRFGSDIEPVIREARSRLFWLCVFVSLWLSYYSCFEIEYLFVCQSSYYNGLRGLQFVIFGLLTAVLLPPYRIVLFGSGEEVTREQRQNNSGYMRGPEPMPPTAPEYTPAPGYSPSTVSTSSLYSFLPPQQPGYYLPPPYPSHMMIHPTNTTIIRYSSSPMIHRGMILQQNQSFPQLHQAAATGNFYFVSQ